MQGGNGVNEGRGLAERAVEGPGNVRRRARPNARRQVLWALAALMALGVGYGLGVLFPGQKPVSGLGSNLAMREPAASVRAAEPSTVPVLPAAGPPILADPLEATVPVYEEPLPAEVHVPAFPVPPAPAVAPKAEAPAGALPAWRQHAVQVPVVGGLPRIAIVIDDLGLDRRRTARTIALRGPLTLAFLPYAGELDKQTAAARAGGHELLVHVPMEPESRTIDPGPNVLAVELDEAALRGRIDWDLSRFAGYVGINNHMGSRFTSAPEGMAVVMDELKRRGLLFLDSRTAGGSVGSRMAGAAGVPHVERNVFLDNVDEPAAVRARLAETEELARRRGLAVAIGHPREATIEALTVWLDEVRQRGFQLIPISATISLPDGWESAQGRVPVAR